MNPLLVPHESVRMRNQNNKRNTFAFHKSRRPSICTTEKKLQNYIPQQRVAPGIGSYASARKSKNKKVCIIEDNHLKQINKNCVKCVQIRSFFWSVFSHIRTEYGPAANVLSYLNINL